MQVVVLVEPSQILILLELQVVKVELAELMVAMVAMHQLTVAVEAVAVAGLT
jgi:hypothetical protein